MKKLFILCCVAAIMLASVIPAHATTMCAADDTIAIVLDPAVNGTAYAYNADLFEWSATFSYGTLWGISTCVGTGGTYGVAVDQLRDSDGTVASGGERTGVNCWCQMTHPAQSRWVFRLAYDSVDDCRSLCASPCGLDVRNNQTLRLGMFGSLGN